MTFAQARQSINRVYKKWEKASFADDPDMGLWRNEDEKFAIQLTDDGFNIVVIYISFALVTDRQLMRGLSRATQLLADESQARQAVSKIHALLKKRDFKSLYHKYCHQDLRKQFDETQFTYLMQVDRGKAIIYLFAAVDDAIQQEKGPDTLIARFTDEDVDVYEFVFVKARDVPQARHMSRIELKVEDGAWKLLDFE